ncbi:MAG: class I SAM-dependent methyltransferase [Pseudomonadales bacterium]|jgi:methyltransferase (TIGR00027 family)|nr:class I SAM-dependent methyltransferase [Pseudomonadales bacterium]
MRPTRPSRTAEAAAFLRAWHSYVDDRPLLCEDFAVVPLLRPQTRAFLQPLSLPVRRALRTRERLQPSLPAMRGQVVVRACYAEEALDAALERGVGQVVVLAAGLDTLALRRPQLLDQVAFFEVDHPATQAWKRQRLGAAADGRVHYVAVEFGRASLRDALLDAGFSPALTTFVNWLGCTYYLGADALRGTLADLGEVSAPGSEIVLDFWTPGVGLPTAQRMLLSGVRFSVALQREPLLGLMTPTALTSLAEHTGWAVDELLSPEDQRRRWLQTRRDSLAVPAFAWLARLVRAA